MADWPFAHRHPIQHRVKFWKLRRRGLAKKRTIEQLEAYINGLMIQPEYIEYRMIESLEKPLFYVLTNRRLIATHVLESGPVGIMSVPYTQIGAVSAVDAGRRHGALDRLVVRDIEIFGSFGRVVIRRSDEEEMLEMYGRLLEQLMHRRLPS